MDIVQNVLSHAVKDIQIRDGHGVVAHVVSYARICGSYRLKNLVHIQREAVFVYLYLCICTSDTSEHNF